MCAGNGNGQAACTHYSGFRFTKFASPTAQWLPTLRWHLQKVQMKCFHRFLISKLRLLRSPLESTRQMQLTICHFQVRLDALLCEQPRQTAIVAFSFPYSLCVGMFLRRPGGPLRTCPSPSTVDTQWHVLASRQAGFPLRQVH